MLFFVELSFFAKGFIRKRMMSYVCIISRLVLHLFFSFLGNKTELNAKVQCLQTGEMTRATHEAAGFNVLC